MAAMIERCCIEGHLTGAVYAITAAFGCWARSPREFMPPTDWHTVCSRQRGPALARRWSTWGTEWKASETAENVYEGHDRASGALKWTATANDLVFASHSVLRALAEVYAQADGQDRFDLL